MVALVDAADAAQALGAFRIAAIAAERITGIGRIGDQPAAAHDLGRAVDEPLLRMRGMDGEELGHQRARNSSSTRASASGWS
jgi:hypothetical protein